MTPSLSISPARMQARPPAGGVSGASARGSHRLAAALTCERLWAFRYLKRILPRAKRANQLVGTLVHTILAYWFAEKLAPDRRPAWFSEATLEEALLADGRGYPALIQRAREIGDWCKHRYAAEHWHPIYVEEEFTATLGQILDDCPPSLVDERITCRTDLVALWNGEAWIVDHKTQRGGANGRLAQWKEDGEYGLSSQVFQNLLILRAQTEKPMPVPVRGFIINRIKSTPPFDGGRHPLRPPEMAYADAAGMIRDAIEREDQILVKIGQGRKPTPNFAACEGRYGKCDYWHVCAARSPEQRQRILDTEFTVGGSHSDEPLIADEA